MEPKARIRRLLDTNYVWFQSHKSDPKVFAQATVVNGAYRWQVFNLNQDSKPVIEGSEETMLKVMDKVFTFFKGVA